MSEKVTPQKLTQGVCRDKDDDKYLECGIACEADYIITGDKDLLALKTYKNIQILTPRAYLEMYDDEFEEYQR
jgi:predicted nucleic acid-binding protein